MICGRLQKNIGGIRISMGSEQEDLNWTIAEIQEMDAIYALFVFIDIAGAFDNLWWPVLFRELREMGWEYRCGALVKFVKTYTTKGCPQGSVCGKMFWDIVMDKLLTILREKELVSAWIMQMT